jgi:glycine cleavage system aminomethyltransferase T/glycine/D-amino acid oxidase-like deaminating enzyme
MAAGDARLGRFGMSSSEFPSRANVVVIGAGIVGNSMAYQLALHGWKDIVLLDKGPFPNPGGSTGHASNFIYLVDHSKEMTKFTVDSVRQYRELGVFTESGGVEVARTPERLEELKRRVVSAKSWGIEPVELLTPREVKELIPFINDEIILGGFHTPGVGVVDSLRAGTLMREKGQELGALSAFGNTEITGIHVADGRVRAVRTDRGLIQAETVVIACGIWSPRVARMAGATIPLTPAVHQMIDVGPVPVFETTVGEIGFPIVRDVDTNMYERQHGSEFEIGSYAHRPILWEPDDIPSIEHSALSPTQLPFTQEDFDPQMEDALELFPDILTDERVGVKLAINGLLSLTPDGFPILGEIPEVKGLWSAAAIWIKEAPGIAKTIAEWMTDGCTEIDAHSSDVARFHDHQRTKVHVEARSAEGYNRTYGIVHPSEQWESNREVRVSPFFGRQRELGVVFFETAGWERPNWYESNRGLLDEYGDRVMPREAEWDSRWWSPIVNAEHLAMRDRVGMFDLTAFAVLDVTGPGALDLMQRIALAQMDVPLGRVVYTSWLNEAGGIKADLTTMRLAPDVFRVVTGGYTGQMDKKWLLDHRPGDGSVQVHDASSAWCTLGVWGPKARDLIGSLTEDDVSNEGFPFATCRWISLGPLRVLASRISYVGELGWELYAPMEQGRRLWDLVMEAGKPHGVIPVGLGVYLTSGRLEKGYRAHGNELELEYDPVEAGMARPRVKEQDFIGKQAHLRQRAEQPAALLCTLTVDDHTSSSGVKRYMLGREPVLTPNGDPLTDARGRRSYVTSAGSGPSVGKHILLSYLPPEQAVVGTKLAVEYFGERYPVTVDVAGSTPLFDPDNERIRR